jgi:acyl-CoA thioesterase
MLLLIYEGSILNKKMAEKIKDFLNKNDQFAKHCGMEIVSAANGEAVGQMKIKKHHLNSVGTVHGGAIFTLADFVFACACNTAGQLSVTVNASVNYHNAVSEGTLTAQAREIARSRKLGTYDVAITDDTGKRIATVTGLSYVKDEQLIK